MKKLINFLRKFNFIIILLFLLVSEGLFSESERKLLVLGDSLSAGYGIPSKDKWVNLVQKKLDQDNISLKLINASLSGETTKGGLSRLPSLLEAVAPDFLFIELGANDGLRGYPSSKIRSNLIGICNLAKEKGISIIIMEIIVAPNYGKKYMQRLNKVYKEVANDFDAQLIPPMLNEQIVLNTDLMLPDGIHPNAKGQYVIAENMYDWISKL